MWLQFVCVQGGADLLFPACTFPRCFTLILPKVPKPLGGAELLCPPPKPSVEQWAGGRRRWKRLRNSSGVAGACPALVPQG